MTRFFEEYRLMAWATTCAMVGCAPLDPGPDYGRDAAATDAPSHDTGRDDTGRDDTGRDDTGRDDTGRDDTGRDDAPSSAQMPLSPNGFFCFVQPLVFRPHRCASEDGCHAERSALRLDPSAEGITPPTCVDGVPTTAVPASYYTNLARSRAEVRGTALRSDLYTRPLGRDHPVDLFGSGSEEARLLRLWIDGR